MHIKEVIHNWTFDGKFVWGVVNGTPSGIRTSTVKRIWFNGTTIHCETQNSYYELSTQSLDA